MVGVFATHQTHSSPGTGSLSFGHKTPLEGRQLGGCAVCARSMWREDLYEMDIFTQPEVAGAKDDVDGNISSSQHNLMDLEGQGSRACKFAVNPLCALKVNNLLGVVTTVFFKNGTLKFL